MVYIHTAELCTQLSKVSGKFSLLSDDHDHDVLLPEPERKVEWKPLVAVDV